ncbi:MAG: SIR2 family protein [Paenibacillus sp.]|uniref:SIR2 family protein n=1 Tax=Paenibacillus sp. TaxID=58172 RepID=UPI002913B216|nr:SIR2 family protein [Paenibacillus sp.]MDU4694540.1 SIR2 family protein [Paenibacillus sp.]
MASYKETEIGLDQERGGKRMVVQDRVNEHVQDRLAEHLKKFDSSPFLFVGSGFSRRYLGLEDWEGLLKRFSAFSTTDYEYYSSSVAGKLEKIAGLLANDFHQVWFTGDEYRESREEFKGTISGKTTPLKIEISKYLREKFYEFGISEGLDKEIESLRQVNIDGVITTNWDCLIEQIFEKEEFVKYIGQKELLFSDPKEINEIYKIHGCCTVPDSLILTDDDYKDFNDRNPYLAAKLLTIFVEHPVVFIGYSLSDENIGSILESITNCLSIENLHKLKDRLIFVQRTKNDELDSFEEGTILINKIPLPITIVKCNDFSNVYKALSRNKRKFSAKLMRKMKTQIYELVKHNDPNNQLHAAIELEQDYDNSKVEFVFGVGISKQISLKGYGSITDNELFEGIVKETSWVPEQIVLETLPLLLRANTYLPVFKYIAESGLSKESLVPNLIKKLSMKYEDFLIRYQRDNLLELRKGYADLNELLSKVPVPKAVGLIPILGKAGTDAEILKEFILTNLNLLNAENQSIRTNFKKLIRYYDWLVYRSKITF